MEVTVISLLASGIKRPTTANYVSKIRMIARFINVLSQEQQEMLGVKAIPKALIDIDVNAINLEIAVARCFAGARRGATASRFVPLAPSLAPCCRS